MHRSNLARPLFAALLACGLLASAGCGGPKVVPVSGTASLDGKPLAGFLLNFIPDADKGHVARMDCSGRLSGDGRYSLRMDDGFKQYSGVPPGWYKVTISSPDDVPLPVSAKYTDLAKTPLSIEVVEKPEAGRYDLKFTK